MMPNDNGFIDSMWKQKCNLYNGLHILVVIVFVVVWKKFSESKKNIADHVECELMLTVFFWHCCLCIVNSYVRNKLYYLEVLKHLERQYQEKKFELWGNNSWFPSIMTVCQQMHCYWFVTFCPKLTQVTQPPYSLTWSQQTLFFKNWNLLRKDDLSQLKTLRKNHNWTNMWSQKRLSRIISWSGNSTGRGASMEEKSTLKEISFTRL